jgi:hypothetical protein
VDYIVLFVFIVTGCWLIAKGVSTKPPKQYTKHIQGTCIKIQKHPFSSYIDDSDGFDESTLEPDDIALQRAVFEYNNGNESMICYSDSWDKDPEVQIGEQRDLFLDDKSVCWYDKPKQRKRFLIMGVLLILFSVFCIIMFSSVRIDLPTDTFHSSK